MTGDTLSYLKEYREIFNKQVKKKCDENHFRRTFSY